ncbi:DUF3888 domain-containing protein [Paenibacillus camerounensis]|uniref:DUF3888 domain-containing protein n=1 Tax=Paenibacillus camerounensis TaxID=1243663 RepID=UPI0005A9289C|nr:DUF3888 domain-containing protein [Paenibacillus camerounensis]
MNWTQNFTVLLLFAALSLSSSTQVQAETAQLVPVRDSSELRIQDTLMNFLTPYINEAVREYYQHSLLEPPLVYPYFVKITECARINGFRGFRLSVTLDVTPVVGPHISVGEDRLTFEISAGPEVRLVNYTHLISYPLPPHWQDIVKKPVK